MKGQLVTRGITDVCPYITHTSRTLQSVQIAKHMRPSASASSHYPLFEGMTHAECNLQQVYVLQTFHDTPLREFIALCRTMSSSTITPRPSAKSPHPQLPGSRPSALPLVRLVSSRANMPPGPEATEACLLAGSALLE